MMSRKRRVAWIVAIALMLPALVAAAGAVREDIPITDPPLLERLRLEPNSTNLYATPQAYAELTLDPADRELLDELRWAQRLANREDSPAGGPYGTGTSGYTAVGPCAMRPWSSGVAHFTDSGERRCLSGATASPAFDAVLGDLPHGARLTLVDVWVRDDSATANHDFVIQASRHCQPDLVPGPPEITVLGAATTTGAPGNALLTIPIDVDVDLESCAYFVRVFMGTVANDCPFGSSLAIQKVRAEWFRQVSSAPASPTFNDDPTTHPFFRHIEALAASEITGGGGGGGFCPDAPLTRGQMADFPASALGLHWGSF